MERRRYRREGVCIKFRTYYPRFMIAHNTHLLYLFLHTRASQVIDRAVREPVIIRVTSAEGLRLDNVTHFFVPLHPAAGACGHGRCR